MRPGGGVPFITNEDIWVTCLAGLVLTEARRPAHELQRCEQFLVSQQQADGGWGYAEGVSQTDADDTSVVLSLLARRNPLIHRPSIRRAVANLLALQNSDGGFPTFVRGAASEAEITAKSITALRASHMAPPAVIDAAWAWLARAQQPTGGFRGEWKLCVTYPAFHVINAAAGQRPGTRAADIRRRCVGFLRDLRRGDGGWPIHPDDRRSHVLSTAYALAGLAACPGSLSSGELNESALALLAGQGRSGGFAAEADSLGPRPFVYDVPLLATLYSVWALARVRDLLSGRATRCRSARSRLACPSSFTTARGSRPRERGRSSQPCHRVGSRISTNCPPRRRARGVTSRPGASRRASRARRASAGPPGADDAVRHRPRARPPDRPRRARGRPRRRPPRPPRDRVLGPSRPGRVTVVAPIDGTVLRRPTRSAPRSSRRGAAARDRRQDRAVGGGRGRPRRVRGPPRDRRPHRRRPRPGRLRPEPRRARGRGRRAADRPAVRRRAVSVLRSMSVRTFS
nr:prenyltransferase/squalene oxidase repeat-containing protein [Nannocystis pusilla]